MILGENEANAWNIDNIFGFLMVPGSVFAEGSEVKTSDCISGCSLPAMIQDNGLDPLVKGGGSSSSKSSSKKIKFDDEDEDLGDAGGTDIVSILIIIIVIIAIIAAVWYFYMKR